MFENYIHHSHIWIPFLSQLCCRSVPLGKGKCLILGWNTVGINATVKGNLSMYRKYDIPYSTNKTASLYLPTIILYSPAQTLNHDLKQLSLPTVLGISFGADPDGSAYLYLWLRDRDSDPDLDPGISSMTFRMTTQTYFFLVYMFFTFWSYIFISRIKSHKEDTK